MPRIPQKTISVADDFGISRLANRNILQLVRNGKVDRVSVLIGYNPESLSQRDIRQLMTSNVKIDLHLDYQILLFRKKERKLKEGTLGRSCSFILGYLWGKGRRKIVEKEWENQIKKFIEIFGKVPDGINSHQYIHLFPSYLKIVLKLAKKYHIPYVRYGKNGMIKSNHMVYRILKWLHTLTINDFNHTAFQSSDFLVSLDWIKNFNKFFEHLPKGTVEIVCHPEREEEFKLMMKYF